MVESVQIERVFVTGATGFVGRSVVAELLARGLTPVCLVRSEAKLRQHAAVTSGSVVPVAGDLHDVDFIRRAAEKCQAAIHLVGIIIERRLRGQTFDRIHVEGTRHVVDAAKQAGVKRFIHMSALGTQPEAVSAYHRTKWAAEEYLRSSGLDWTILRPSLIHGGDGEFMRLLNRFICDYLPPVIPYFGTGEAKLQPVSVKDVAHCLVESLFRPETVGQVYPLGGPKSYSWRDFYRTSQSLMPRAKRHKPMVSLPVPLAKAAAVLSGPPMALLELAFPSLGMFRFDIGQVRMAQENSVCDHTIAEQAFGVRLRSLEQELADYADQIGR